MSQLLRSNMCDEFINRKWTQFKKRRPKSAPKRKQRKITKEQFVEILSARQCYYTGLFMNFYTNDPFSLSIDRVDAKRPYTFDNIVACCAGFNSIKGTYEGQGLSEKRAIQLAKKMFRKKYITSETDQ